MRTRPPKAKRQSTTIGGISRKTGPVFREVPITEAFGSPADVKASIERLRAWRGPPTLDFDAYLLHRWMFGDWTPKPPPPLALNLNVSAEVPTLSTLDAE